MTVILLELAAELRRLADGLQTLVTTTTLAEAPVQTASQVHLCQAKRHYGEAGSAIAFPNLLQIQFAA